MKTPFRVLYREFLFRVVDLEMLSLKGDVAKLLGQFASLLCFLSILLSLPIVGFGSGRLLPAPRVMLGLSEEHFLIATTMLVVGLFAVLSWDSTFPDRRDVLVLAPLPLKSSTIFFAKVAAVATALGLTVVLLHIVAGLGWPLALGVPAYAHSSQSLSFDTAPPFSGIDDLKKILDRDVAAAGPLAPGTGICIGVLKQGARGVFTYGAAKPDSIFQIGSLTKTFTSLALAQMVEQGMVNLDDPVRAFLPADLLRTRQRREIRLVDLATHQSGLPPMPNNLTSRDSAIAGAEYHAENLYEYLARRGLGRPPIPGFIYSDLGASLLGLALANRAGVPYPQLVHDEITEPLAMNDTAILLTPKQKQRLLQGFDRDHHPVPAWDLDAFAPSGAINSNAGEMLTFLEANLHPEKLSSAKMRRAIEETHKLRADASPNMRIGLDWMYANDTHAYWHNGAIGGYTSYAFFDPQADYAAIVFINNGISGASFADRLGELIRQRLAGQPTMPLGSVHFPTRGRFFSGLRMYAAYWSTMALSGAFIFFSVLGLQGIAAQLLSRELFLRVSSFLQLAAFCLFVAVYFLQPGVLNPAALSAAHGSGWLSWSPSFWFLVVFQQLNGSPGLAPLARRAWIALGIACSLTTVAYALSYFRTLRRIVEEPDIVPGSHAWRWLPRFGDLLHTAIVHFSIRTLLRSRQHRVIFTFYAGIGFALSIFYLKTAQGRSESGNDAPIPWLFATVALMCLFIVGMRVVFSIPLTLRSNWIFRVTETRPPGPYLEAIRRPMFVLAVAPVWIVSAAILLWIWPWQHAVKHLIVLAIVGFIVSHVCLTGYQKIPFTCSYLPGKTYVHMAFLTALGLVLLISRGVTFESSALDDRNLYGWMVGILLFAAIAARWRTVSASKSIEAIVQFEEAPVPAIQLLGLQRDGVSTF
jgi:CubicO group peptidase (beta-lactamase class C family)